MNKLEQVQETWNKLTPREIEIVKAAAEGSSIKKTADLFSISASTVQSHRHNVIEKLKCGNITGAVNKLIRAGLI